MKVTGLDDKDYVITLRDYEAGPDKLEGKSSLHKRAYVLLKELFPSDPIFQEVYLPGAGPSLYLDLFLNRRLLAVECQGKQHFEQVSFFQKNRLEFAKSKFRDTVKRSWCELNNITLVELPYDEDDDQWRSRLTS